MIRGKDRNDQLTDSKQAVALVQQVNVQAPQYQQEKRLARTAIADPAGAGLGSGTIYTVPSYGNIENSVLLGPRAKILRLWVTQTTASCSFDLHHVAYGGSATANNKIGSSCVAQKDAVLEIGIMMEAGEFLYVANVSNTNVTSYFNVIGVEYF